MFDNNSVKARRLLWHPWLVFAVAGKESALLPVPFEFQRGANVMMKLYREKGSQEDNL
jgi:hypothetical protein